MLGQDVKLNNSNFQPYLTDHKTGYFEVDQLKPGVIMCPFCDTLIDCKEKQLLKSTHDAIQVWPQSWASVPICNCKGGSVWAVYDPNVGKWAFRAQDYKLKPRMEDIDG